MVATKIMRGLRSYDLKAEAEKTSFIYSSGCSVAFWGIEETAGILEVHSGRTRGSGTSCNKGNSD